MRHNTRLRRITSASAAVFVVLLATHATTSSAAMFSNGSFEDPDVGGQTGKGPGFINFTDGWDVTAGRITIFDDSSGSGSCLCWRSIHYVVRDNGTSGTIEQVFDTIVNQSYTVSWDEGYASTAGYNQFNPPSTGTYTVEILNANNNASLASDTGQLTADVNDGVFGVTFAPASLSFVATSNSSVLRFAETANSIPFNSYGPAIDNVMVTAVPEPGNVGDLRPRWSWPVAECPPPSKKSCLKVVFRFVPGEAIRHSLLEKSHESLV